MRLLLKAVVACLLLAVVAVGALLLLVPKDAVRDRVVALVEAETGRTLTIGGDTSFTFYPTLGISISDVALSNPAGMEGGPMLRMAALNIDLELRPLLSRDVQVERFVMVRPVIDLRVDRAGRTNWLFEPRAARGAMRDAGGSVPLLAAALVPPALAQPALRGLRLGEVRIEEGLVSYHDERDGRQHRAEAVNVALALPGLAEPLAAQGDLSWRGQRVAFGARIDAPAALADGGASPIHISLDTKLLQGEFAGTVSPAKLAAEGTLDMRSPSLRELGAWLEADLPAGRGLGPMSFAGRVEIGERAVAVSRARLSLDGMTAQGDVALALAGARPSLRAALNVDKLDFNAYLAATSQARDSARPSRSAPSGQAPGAGPRRGQSLTDFIEELSRGEEDSGRPAPQVRGWSDRAFDLAPLRALDAQVRLNAGQVLYQDLKFGRSAAQLTLREAVLTADITDFQLYDGVGSGRLTLNGARSVPALALRLDVDGISALPLFRDGFAFDWISGKARLALNLSGAGRSQSELVRALKGNGSVQFTDGAIEGVNIPQMVRALGAGQLTEWRRQDTLKTDFSRLSGTFTMDKGVARNDDLELVGPLLRVTGSGQVDLPREWIDFRFMPRIVASLEGQNGAQDLRGVTVPARLEGPLDNPRLQPDLQRLMEDPQLARKAAEEIGRAVERLRDGDGRQVQQLLQQFLGGDEQPAGEATREGEPAQQQQRPADMLRQLLRR